MSQPTATSELRVLPANEVSWEQLQTVFGQRGEAASCQCQWFLARDKEFTHLPREEVIAAFGKHFRNRYRTVDGALTPDELARAERLRAEKFENPEWTARLP